MKKLLSIISSYKELIHYIAEELIHYIAEELIHLFIEYLISVLQKVLIFIEYLISVLQSTDAYNYVCKLIVSVHEVIIFFI